MPIQSLRLVFGSLIAGIALPLHAVGAQEFPGFECSPRSGPVGCYWEPTPNPTHDSILLGKSLVTGDFDGDGYGDIAAGEPYWTPPTVNNGGRYGRVTVVYGAPAGATPRIQKFLQSHIGDEFTQEFAMLGYVLAAGDFNGDGADDLVVFARWTTVDGAHHYLIPGGAQGLSPGAGSVMAALPGGNALSQSLIVGDFDGDGSDDLAQGLPYASSPCPGGYPQGQVTVAFGDPAASLLVRRTIKPEQGTGVPLCRSGFGASLAVGDVAGGTADDLVVGAPGLQGFPEESQGAVLAYRVTPQRDLVWVRSYLETGLSPGMFGEWGIAVGNFDGVGYHDVAVGNGRRYMGPATTTEEDAVVVFLNDGIGNVEQQVLPASAFGLPQDHGTDETGRALAALDLDGDGLDDLVVGAPHAGGVPGHGLGAVVLARGTTGIGLQPWAIGSKGLLGPATLTDLTGSSQFGSAFGSISAPVDRNRDGRPEVALGAPELHVFFSPTEFTSGAGLVTWADFGILLEAF